MANQRESTRHPRRGAATCAICGIPEPSGELVPAAAVRESLAAMIREEHPDWSPRSYICRADLNQYRTKYVQDVLLTDKGELSAVEEEVLDSLKKQELLSENVDLQFESRLSIGERVADKVAEFGGSWKFILTFGAILVSWIGVNSFVLLQRPFDPFPFILLNLVLSCLAAIQAPVIMMSQNRQESRDRLRAVHDYQVNLKAEIEIRALHEKMDHLMLKQWQRLLDIQEIQLETMEEFTGKAGRQA